MKQKSVVVVILMIAFSYLAISVSAHPLGQLSINHYTRLTMIGGDRGAVEVRYVVDLAELPTFREAQLADTDASGEISAAEMEAYLETVSEGYRRGLELSVDGQPLPLTMTGRSGEILAGQTGSAAMGLATLRLVFDLRAPLEWTGAHRFQLRNQNFTEKPGWREMVVTAAEGLSIYDSSIAGNGLTDELRAYPESMLTTPLDERSGEWTASLGEPPPGARPLIRRDGQPAAPVKDRFLALITVPELTPLVILAGLLIAFGLGAVHALSPGHGKALVGAYLAGSRGTPRHAVLLGLTVTIAHTLTVYLGGVAFIFASKYILPERLYPVLSFISGAMIMVIGAGLVIRRLRWSREIFGHQLQHLLHDHQDDGHHHHHQLEMATDTDKLSTRRLLQLGISGGIIPCPSAWILLLGAISLNRTAYGLVLILAFSLGLATVLTVIGLLFIHGGRLLGRLPQASGMLRVLPTLSGVAITMIGGAMAWQALRDAGIDPALFWTIEVEEQRAASALAILGLGLVIGLRHALDTDHLAAVSAIVSERRNLFSSLLIGGLWGLGHTISLLVVGVGVIILNLQIQRYEKALEFCVALMLIGLGLNVLYQLFRERPFHFHEHRHGEQVHAHLHQHEGAASPASADRSGRGWSLRPLFIGMVHGLAGSAGLMLGVLATISAAPLAFAYILIFGLGSIGGMMVMSVILGLPAHFTAQSFTRTHLVVRAASGMFSLGFGAWLVYEIGFVEGLLK